MPTHVTTNTSANAVLTTWLNKDFVSDLEFMLQHQKCTTKAVIPAGSGNIGRFISFAAPTKYTSYSGAGQANITEASTSANEITQVNQTSTDITIQEFGEFTKIGTMYEYAAVAGLRQRLIKRLKDGAAFSIDRFVLTKALLSTTVRYATNSQIGSNGSFVLASSVVGSLGAAAIISSRKTLVENLAQGFKGEPGIPDGHYTCVLTPGQEQDIVTEFTTQRTTWSNAVVNVPGTLGQDKFVKGYLGSIYQVACLVTQNYTTLQATTGAQATTGVADVAILYADGGVGAMAFGDMNPEIIINDVNSPYKNVNSVAWHAMFGAGLIDSNRVLKLYSQQAA